MLGISEVVCLLILVKGMAEASRRLCFVVNAVVLVVLRVLLCQVFLFTVALCPFYL